MLSRLAVTGTALLAALLYPSPHAVAAAVTAAAAAWLLGDEDGPWACVLLGALALAAGGVLELAGALAFWPVLGRLPAPPPLSLAVTEVLCYGALLAAMGVPGVIAGIAADALGLRGAPLPRVAVVVRERAAVIMRREEAPARRRRVAV
jgi:hypothetical protein